MLKTWEPEHKATLPKTRRSLHAGNSSGRGELPLWVLLWPVLVPPPTLPAMGQATQELPRPWGGGEGLCWGLLLCCGLAVLWGARRDHGLCPLVKKQREGSGGSRSDERAERSGLEEDAGRCPLQQGEVQRRSRAPTLHPGGPRGNPQCVRARLGPGSFPTSRGCSTLVKAKIIGWSHNYNLNLPAG